MPSYLWCHLRWWLQTVLQSHWVHRRGFSPAERITLAILDQIRDATQTRACLDGAETLQNSIVNQRGRELSFYHPSERSVCRTWDSRPLCPLNRLNGPGDFFSGRLAPYSVLPEHPVSSLWFPSHEDHHTRCT